MVVQRVCTATSAEMHIVIEYVYYSVQAESVEEKFLPNQQGKIKLFLFISMNHKILRFFWEVSSNGFSTI